MTSLGSLAINPDEAALAVSRRLSRNGSLPQVGSVHQALRNHAELHPDRPAIVEGSRTVTYAEARRLVDAAAGALATHGCRAGDVVAVSGPRSGNTILLFLALESLGAIYLPIDPAWPRERCLGVLRLSGVSRLIAHPRKPPEAVEEAASEAGVPVQVIDVPSLAVPQTGGSIARRDPTGVEPRYIIFTSGTTGIPKGAVVEQRGMMNHLHAKIDDLGLSQDDIIAFTAPLAFDISIWQMLVATLTGGTVVVLDDARTAFPQRLLRALQKHRVTVAEFVPTVIGWLVEQLSRGDERGALPALRWLISTGEELHPALAARALRTLPAVQLLNAYGPTECSDDVTHHVVTLADTRARRIPVGGPIANTALYILVRDGEKWRAAANGEPGELFVGGLGVGAGYVDDVSATAAAFFVDGLDPASPTGRLYRTGDLAAICDGTVQYLGRRDRQVKVSGVRIELDEVEAVIERHPGVARCAAVAVKADGRTDLVAYVVAADPAVTFDDLTDFLCERVPSALIPRHWRWLAKLPLTPNGKTDYQMVGRWSHDREQELNHAD